MNVGRTKHTLGFALQWWRSPGGQVEGYLEEMLLLAQRAEEYNQFMLAKMTEAMAPAPLPAARHNDFRQVHSCCEPSPLL